MDRDEELRQLMAEQEKDKKYGQRAWPEFKGIASLDYMASAGLDFDQDGQLVRHNTLYIRNAPVRTRKHGRPREDVECPKHPGEMMRKPGTGWAYCRGCARDKTREKLGYTRVKRRKIDGPRTNDDIKADKARYNRKPKNKAKVAAYNKAYYARRKAMFQTDVREVTDHE